SPKLHSMCWRNRLWLAARLRAALRRRTSRAINQMMDGMRTSYLRSQSGPIPIAISRVRRSTPCSQCYRKESLPSEAATAPICITTASIASCERGAGLAAITSGGTIPDNALFTVVAEPDGVVVGTVDEDFATESMAGEVMLLGNTSWRIRRIEYRTGRLLVENAHGAAPGIPFWLGEGLARTSELSAQLGELRKQISDRLPGVVPVEGWRNLTVVAAAVTLLREECGLDLSGAEQLIQYILEGRAVLGDVPTQATIIAERFFDEGGGMQLIIHAPFGGRI